MGLHCSQITASQLSQGKKLPWQKVLVGSGCVLSHPYVATECRAEGPAGCSRRSRMPMWVFAEGRRADRGGQMEWNRMDGWMKRPPPPAAVAVGRCRCLYWSVSGRGRSFTHCRTCRISRTFSHFGLFSESLLHVDRLWCGGGRRQSLPAFLSLSSKQDRVTGTQYSAGKNNFS